MPTPALRLRLDGAALAHNWLNLARLSRPAQCGATVKADAYGLGAREVVRRLAQVGCRHFFVATWREAHFLADVGLTVSVLHGLRDEDVPAITLPNVQPVLNSRAQVERWRSAGERACDVMIDTGMNRLGLTVDEVRTGLLDGLQVDTLMSHLACAESDSDLNARQLATLLEIAHAIPHRRLSLANSAGIALGRRYALDLTRPGLALYGGVPRRELSALIRAVVTPEAQVIQRRTVERGDSVGYGCTWTADAHRDVAVVNLGYADGYLRRVGARGYALAQGVRLPVRGSVTMDSTTVDVTHAPHVAEGEWISFPYDLPTCAAATDLSQYELLTVLGARLERYWV